VRIFRLLVDTDNNCYEYIGEEMPYPELPSPMEFVVRKRNNSFMYFSLWQQKYNVITYYTLGYSNDSRY